MRSIWRTLSAEEARNVLLVSVAVLVTGVSYGATATAAGFPAWLPPVLAIVVLAGSAEFLYVGILAAGGGVAAAVVAALLVNARHLPYGMATRDLVGSGWRRLIGAHLMNDESVALGLGAPDRARGRALYWACGVGVLVGWPLGAGLGVLLGKAVGDPNAVGLDAMFPAVIAALVVPALRAGRGRRPALVGAVLALVATPFVPPGIAPLVALLALATGGRPHA